MIEIPSEYRHFFYKKNLYFVAGASAALYLYLKANNISDKKVVCPSNICYTVPYTILGSGNRPIFCDIDPMTGNAALSSIQTLLSDNDDIAAVILPHMFGNPVKERDRIYQLCKKRSLFFIEDCAGALGMDDVSGHISKEADAVIFSFNDNKHIALGKGGLLATDMTIDIKSLSKTIKNDEMIYRDKSVMIDRLYKPILYSEYHDELIGNLSSFNDFFKDSFIYTFQPDTEYVRSLHEALAKLEENINFRRSIIEYIDTNILWNLSIVQKYSFEKGASPWRYNLLVQKPEDRKRLIKKFLDANLPVSIWYPPVDPIFGYPMQEESRNFSKKILNFDFINASKTQIDRFICILNHFIEKEQ